MNDREWTLIIDEIEWYVGQLRASGPKAIERVRHGLAAGNDGYPTNSLPESSISGGRGGDPTGRAVIARAGGRDAESGDSSTTRDTWRGPRDPVAAAVSNMRRETTDALARLHGAVASMTTALQSKGATTEGTQRE